MEVIIMTYTKNTGRSYTQSCFPKGFTCPSSSRKVSMRDIGAANTLYPAHQHCGVTARVGRGFTLIELLVVVLIIGILAAVAVPQYQKAVLKSRLAQWDVMFNTANKAVDMYVLENGWPVSPVHFTGTSRVETGIEMPGNCDIDRFGCYTSAGQVQASFAEGGGSNGSPKPALLYVSLSGAYNADGTRGNKALGNDNPNLMYIRMSDGLQGIIVADGKAGCLWASTHPDIQVDNSDLITECKNSYGVTLPNPVYAE